MERTLQKIQSPAAVGAARGADDLRWVVVAGTFDMIHPGTLLAIRRACRLGDRVLAVVEPDPAPSAEGSGRRCQNTLESRMELVAALREVACVTTVGGEAAAGFFRKLGPYVIVAPDVPGAPGPLQARALEQAATVDRPAGLEGCSAGAVIAAMEQHRTPIALPAGWDRYGAEPGGRRAQDPLAVSANGCFDILHVGHVRFLETARAMGENLTVFINSDSSVARYKGPTRPVFPQAFREAALRALASVDQVVVFDGDDPLPELARYRPALHVKGGSYEPERVRQERELLESWGGRLASTPLVEGFSTTAFIRKALGL